MRIGDVVQQFFAGTPTIYDLASYVIVVCLLIVVISIHLRQRRHAAKIARIENILKSLYFDKFGKWDDDV